MGTISTIFGGIVAFVKTLPKIIELIERGVNAIENLYLESKRSNNYKKLDLAIQKAKHEGKTQNITDLFNSL